MNMKHAQLIQTFDRLRELDPRNAAEYAYILAVLFLRDGDTKEAIRFGLESIALFDQCPMETYEDCVARNHFIDGVALPDLIHQEVVRDRLKPLPI